ncbi:MAG: GNAT family N-acetyltransferase [Desulfopila sp.]|nr:GNAT family N-acetyltransferase [Desulfopila sp.]
MENSVSDPPENIEIKTVSVKELQKFYENCLTSPANGQVIPISSARVRAQLSNPCANDDDIVLVTAFSGSRCVGYHGLLPGIFLCNGRSVKVYWGSTIFVAPDLRGRGIGKLLIMTISGLNVDFVASRMNEKAENTYHSIGLDTLGYLRYRQLRVDKLAKTQSQRDVSSAAEGDSILNSSLYTVRKKALYSSLLLSPALQAQQLVAKEVARINDWPGRKAGFSEFPRFYRSVEVINWMLEYPWLTSEYGAESKEGYYFSTTRKLFTYRAFQIYGKRSGMILGFVVVSILSHKKRKVVKLLDYDFKSSENVVFAVVVALRCAEMYLADRVEYGEELSRYLDPEIVPTHLIKEQERLYLFHAGNQDSALLQNKEKIILNYCDGDAAFA